MQCFRLSLAIFIIGLFSIFSLGAHAQVESTTIRPGVVEKQVIVTAVPAPKEVIVTPEGYVNCFTVKAGWYQDVWIAEHRVCQYANTPSGVAWIEGYWACTKYDSIQGQCTNWEWKGARWEKTLVVY